MKLSNNTPTAATMNEATTATYVEAARQGKHDWAKRVFTQRGVWSRLTASPYSPVKRLLRNRHA